MSEINDHVPSSIQIVPILAIGKVHIDVEAPYAVRFTQGKLHKILGFNQGDVLQLVENLAPNKADITAGVENLLIHCDLVDAKASYSNGEQSQILYSVSPPTELLVDRNEQLSENR